MPEPTQYTLLRVFSGIGGRKCYNTFSFLLTSVRMTTIWFPKLKKYVHTKQFQPPPPPPQKKKKNLVYRSTEPYVRWHQWCLPLSPSLATNCRQPCGALLKVINSLYEYSVLHSSSNACSACHNKTINNDWKHIPVGCFLPVAPVNIPPVMVTFTSTSHVLSNAYISPISYVSTFPPPQPTPSCHNLRRTYPCRYACIHSVLCVLF